MTPRTVLVVDDERAVRDLVATALRRAGYQVQTAASGEEALELESRQPVDLLVTDVILPNIGGAELARRIRQRSPETRVLFISGYTGTKLRAADLGPGCAFLAKPFGTTTLLARVEELLDWKASDTD